MSFLTSGATALLQAGACALSTFLRYVPLRFFAGGAFVYAYQHPEQAANAYAVANKSIKNFAASLPSSKLLEVVTNLSAQVDPKYKAIAFGSALAYDNLSSSATARYAIGALAVWGYYNPESVKNGAIVAGECLMKNPPCVAAALSGIAILLAAKSAYRHVVRKLSPEPKPVEPQPEKPSK